METPAFTSTALKSLLWSVIDAAADCECGPVLDGVIYPGIFGDAMVRDADGVFACSPYIWSDEVTASHPVQCGQCGEWIGTGQPLFRRQLFTEPCGPTSFCPRCLELATLYAPKDRVIPGDAPKGWDSVGYGGGVR